MFAVVGLSHHTAPIQVRERMALEREQIEALLKQLVAQPEIEEALVLSTCNRVEVMAAARAGVEAERLDHAVRAQMSVFAEALSPYLYGHTGPTGLRHLFRVACSLDSLVVGEPQILGQLKQAVELAQEIGTVGAVLRRATTHAIRTAKRVRTETALGVGQVSVPSVAVDLTRRIFGDLRGRKAALLGLGEMGQLVAKQLGGEGAQLFALGRQPDKVASLAQVLGAKPRSLAELEATLLEVDVLVAMTSAHGFVVEYETVARLVRQRRGRPLFFVDLSVPRNIDPRLDGLDDVFLYNIDDLSQIVHDTKSSRKGEAERAEQIVLEETRNFERATSAESVTPMVVALRRRIREALRAEHDKSRRSKLRDLSPEHHECVERMLDAAVNKILHAPTMRLREAASNPADAAALEAFVAALTELFGLDSEEPAPARESLAPRANRSEGGRQEAGKERRDSRTPPAAEERRSSERAGEVG
ncbi:MAG TPA: glutamyl-tRNA reductase [Polyangiaceae bacterium]|nr:glutamyl-tRNA reductase [Polyangiaceae bacterium]